KLGILLLNTYLITVAIDWEIKESTDKERYANLEKLRKLGRSAQLFLQEEVRPVAIALFGSPSLIFHLGFEQGKMVNPHWYRNSKHLYLQAIIGILDELSAWKSIQRLEFLISSGDDPMLGLQVQLDRHTFPLTQKPSQYLKNLEMQTIYSFS
ncbi:MAG: bifunctional 3,4-dihydroxy-2-butanone-4-phosphate synthase/GTP cyclohydrolase II, partial [cyanobacterium endosymbiont of Rhopalodia inflata]